MDSSAPSFLTSFLVTTRYLNVNSFSCYCIVLHSLIYNCIFLLTCKVFFLPQPSLHHFRPYILGKGTSGFLLSFLFNLLSHKLDAASGSSKFRPNGKGGNKKIEQVYVSGAV